MKRVFHGHPTFAVSVLHDATPSSTGSGWSTVRNCRETPASATSAPAPPGIIIGVGKDKSAKRNANVQYALCPCFSPLVIHARSYFLMPRHFFSHSSQLCYPSYVLMFKLPRPVSFRNFFCPAYLLRGREGWGRGGVLKRERNLFARTCSFLFARSRWDHHVIETVIPAIPNYRVGESEPPWK